MLPTCAPNEGLESEGAATALPARLATGSLRRPTAGEDDSLDAARGMAIGCVAGVICWLLLGALLYWLLV